MITLEAHICDQRRSYVVKFSTDEQAVAFINRKASTYAFAEIEDSPLDPAVAPKTVARLYPTCPHGLSEWLCADPINHYPADL